MKHVFKSSFKKSDHLLLAYIYPYTYLDHLYCISEIEKRCLTNDKVFFEKVEIG